MTKTDLLKIIEKPIGKKQVFEVAKAIVQNSQAVTDLYDLSLNKSPEVAFRSSWILENVYHNNPELISSNPSEFLIAYKRQTNQSCKRHYTKILMLLLGKSKVPLEKIDEVIDVTFGWLIDPKTPVAVKVNCLDILFLLKDKSDWIKDELPSQIAFLLKDGSSAMQIRGKKLLQKLNRK